MKSDVEVYFYKNDMLLRVRGLKDERNDSFADSNWTVEATVLDQDDNQVSGQTWPVGLEYESGTDGDFVANISGDLDVSVGDRLTTEIDITSDLGFSAFVTVPVIVERRED